MKSWLVAVYVFMGVCGAGEACALAGGVHWGTMACGLSTMFTLIAAVLVSSLAAYCFGKDEDTN